jgi:2-hydroxychromene-2-carboxylate isomerase
MPRTLEFFFDYGSPYSYLASHRLPGLAARTGVELRYRPMLLGGVFKATGNQSPMLEPIAPKRAYSGLALQRSAEAYGVEFRGNPHFPINTLMLMRSAIAAQQLRVFDAFHQSVYPAFWVQGLDLGDEAVLAKLLAGAGLDAAAIAEARSRDEVKNELRRNTDEAVQRGAFGAPTFFLGDEMFFGADHLFFVERALGRDAT